MLISDQYVNTNLYDGSSADICAIERIKSAEGGKIYENLMSEAMAAHCIKNDFEFKIITGTKEDRYEGTDFRIYSDLDIITSNAGILRFDFTTSFSKKDNMPILWKPQKEIEALKGTFLRFGIRTGNKIMGFENPVIVLGFDALKNKNPEDDVDIDITKKELYSFVVKQMNGILLEAGNALAAYQYVSESNYRAYINANYDDNESLWKPDVTALRPNPSSGYLLYTHQPSKETFRGLRIRKHLMKQGHVEISNTHAFDPDIWGQELEKAINEMREKDTKHGVERQ